MDATFELTITGKEYGEWQGNLRTEDNRELRFRSVLELLCQLGGEVEKGALSAPLVK